MIEEAPNRRELEGTLLTLISALQGNSGEGQIVVPRERHADAQSKEQAKYRALVEQIPAITFTVSLEEGVPEIYIGPQIERILGFTQKEWMGDPILWFNQCHPDDREIWHREFARGIETGGPFKADCRVFAKDRSIKWLHGEAVLVRDDTGQPLFLQGIAFDVTEAKQAEQKLKEAQEVKLLNERLNAVGQMAASIGHDLRNPLGAIRNAWFYLKKHIDDGDDIKKDKRYDGMSKVIDRELQQCATILSELLEFSRDREPFRQPCPVAPLIDETFDVVKRPYPTQLLVNEVPEDMRVPNVDLTQFRQVLINLVQNAVEAIKPDGTVRVRAREIVEDAAIEVEVIDDGVGIAEELRENIWKPLFTTKAKGTGLGLPIVANIVQRHGGTVFTTSAPGRGATFRICVPISTPTPGDAPRQGGAAEGATGSAVQYTRRVEAVRQSCPIQPLIEEVFAVVAKPSANIVLKSSVPPDLPVPQLDPAQFRSALVNLVQNGLEAVGPRGTIEVRASRDGEQILLEVIDDGAGISDEFIEQIWKPLFTTKVRGTGLGLPSARGAIERHGGSITVESELNHGTTFSVRIPIGVTEGEKNA